MPQAAHGSQRESLSRLLSSEHPFPSDSVVYRSMAEQVAAAIRRAIATGILPPGHRLVETKIAHEMGTSRGPLREALFQLEREGMVVRKPNQGTCVVGLTEELVRQIASLRGVLEGFAVRLAVKRLTEEDLSRLKSIVVEMAAMARAGDFPAVVEHDYQFHAYIVRASGHPLLHETWTGLDRRIRIYLSSLNRMHGDLKALVKAHQAIIRALRTRDSERVSRVMADHMVEVLEAYVSTNLRNHPSAGKNDTAAPLDAAPVRHFRRLYFLESTYGRQGRAKGQQVRRLRHLDLKVSALRTRACLGHV